jgi:hypothetical protein
MYTGKRSTQTESRLDGLAQATHTSGKIDVVAYLQEHVSSFEPMY